MAQVAAALDRRAARLLRLPGVVGVAVGFRRRNGRLEDEPVITVFVRPGLKRRRMDKVPRHRRIPQRLRVRLGGQVRSIPLDLVPSQPGQVQRGSQALVPPGEVVGNERSPRNVGTVGWPARFVGADPRPVVCGACHVFLRLRGSRFTGSRDKTFVFSEDDAEFIAMDRSNHTDRTTGFVLAGRRGGPLDAAVAMLLDGTPTRQIPGLGQMGRLRELTPDDLQFPRGPRVSMRVGRGDLLDGNVTRYPAQMAFRYEDTGDLVIEDLIETDLRARGGDSGGLLVDEDIRPLGMLLGTVGRRSYFVHLKNVASEFGLQEL